MAVVVWNGLYDLRITLGVRDYLMKQALHDAGRGPAVTISEAMTTPSGTPCRSRRCGRRSSSVPGSATVALPTGMPVADAAATSSGRT